MTKCVNSEIGQDGRTYIGIVQSREDCRDSCFRDNHSIYGTESPSTVSTHCYPPIWYRPEYNRPEELAGSVCYPSVRQIECYCYPLDALEGTGAYSNNEVRFDECVDESGQALGGSNRAVIRLVQFCKSAGYSQLLILIFHFFL